MRCEKYRSQSNEMGFGTISTCKREHVNLESGSLNALGTHPIGFDG